jgi:hypothetical protein
MLFVSAPYVMCMLQDLRSLTQPESALLADCPPLKVGLQAVAPQHSP